MALMRVGVLSLAKIQGLLMLVIGLIIGVIMMIAIPIIYGLFGFIGGAIGGLIYNALAGVVGGIKIDLEGAMPSAYVPPPQQPWSPSPQT